MNGPGGVPLPRSVVAALVVGLLALLAAPAPRSPAAPTPADVAEAPPGITADAAVLIDYGTARVLWAKDARAPRAPASTTKMMTALVALEAGDPEAEVTVSPAAAATPGSSAHLRAGDRYTLRALIEALLMRSGNDAAVAIAQHVAGSVPAFAALMNARARRLGLESTNFVNPHGLTEPFHYSSAYDLALIARAALAIPAFAEIVDSAERRIEGYDVQERAISRSLYNTNRLLFVYDWIDGVKTGTTSAAGNCLVASGTRGGMRLIAVVLHSDDRWGDAVRLLQWGFTHFSYLQPAVAGEVVRSVALPGARRGERLPLVAAATLAVPVSLDELPRTRVTLRLTPGLRAPVWAGERVGNETLYVGGEPLASVALLAGRSVRSAFFLARWWQGLRGR